MAIRPTKKVREELNEEVVTENEELLEETEEVKEDEELQEAEENEETTVEETEEAEDEEETEIITIDGVDYEVFTETVKFEEGEFDRVAYVAELLDMTKKDAREAIQTVVDAIAYEVVLNGVSKLPGMGKFELVVQAARKARNPKTGEEIEVPEKNTIKYRPNAEAKEWANDPYLPTKLTEDGKYGFPVEEEEE